MSGTNTQLSTVGKRMVMTDAHTKIVGLGKYADDLSVPGMLIGRILHSPHAHARILSIDASLALALPGVEAVATGKDAPTPYGILPIGHDECVFATDKVRYIGDNVAAVAATSAEIAERALDLIRVEYEPLPGFFDPEESMKAESNWIHESRPNNIEKEYHHVFGDPEAGFREADFVAEQRYFAGEVNHAAMEPHATLAIWEPNERMTVYSSTQVPYYLHRTISEVCEMPMSQIRVIKPLIGSGFGGKSEVIPIEIAASVLAKKTKKPVKITYTREEVFYAHRGRPRTIVDLKMGITREGKIAAVEARVVQDGGAYCGFGPVTVLYSGALLGAIYDVPAVRYDGYRVLTNKPACGAMRGHGTVNVRFAFESMLDQLACKAGLDPADVRRKNLLKAPCITVNGLRVTSYGLPECIEKVVARSGWNEKRGKLAVRQGNWNRVQPLRERRRESDRPLEHASHHCEHQDRSRCRGYRVFRSLGYRARFGHDAGPDCRRSSWLTASAHQVGLGDTELTPIDLGSYSSRVTFMAATRALTQQRRCASRFLRVWRRSSPANQANSNAWMRSFEGRAARREN